ncbi:hypothetical protein PoB_004477800 [Plakobranchus ocellatus]|uniref:Uncharacterized protein n=1 Tax=Plakobranchus ocellatus TaxID=259542 RepID=A0AAV4BGJ2_9GAST|nr:hypothetical protein PoB_004477800 [Plakobranchus ocellatus]
MVIVLPHPILTKNLVSSTTPGGKCLEMTASFCPSSGCVHGWQQIHNNVHLFRLVSSKSRLWRQVILFIVTPKMFILTERLNLEIRADRQVNKQDGRPLWELNHSPALHWLLPSRRLSSGPERRSNRRVLEILVQDRYPPCHNSPSIRSGLNNDNTYSTEQQPRSGTGDKGNRKQDGWMTLEESRRSRMAEEDTRSEKMEDINRGLHPALDGQSLQVTKLTSNSYKIIPVTTIDLDLRCRKNVPLAAV